MNYFQRKRDKEIRKRLRDSKNLYIKEDDGITRLIAYKDIRKCSKGITNIDDLVNTTWFIPF